jgi:hypothetical protein
MANASDYLEQQIYNHIFRGDTFAKPTNIFIGLTLDVPQDDGTYTEVADANGYARYVSVSGDNRWTVHGVDGPGSNSAEFVFDTATGDWGLVSGVIITDSQTHSGGNVLIHGELTTAKLVENGDAFRFSIGDLDVTVS